MIKSFLSRESTTLASGFGKLLFATCKSLIPFLQRVYFAVLRQHEVLDTESLASRFYDPS